MSPNNHPQKNNTGLRYKFVPLFVFQVTLPANENASIAGSLEHVAPVSERILDDDEIPLLNLAQRSNQKG